VTADARFELRHLRTFIVVAERESFTRAADDLHIAQQAVSQQIRALESAVGVQLLDRGSRSVTPTPAGAVFLADAERVLAAADRAARRAKAAARGEVGSLRVAYTLTTVWETVPTLLARFSELWPELRVEPREVFGGDVERLLANDDCDLALAPATSYGEEYRQRAIRREALRVAVGEEHALAGRARVDVAELSEERFELWPRVMAPGFYDTVLGVCRAAGFEPSLDEHAAGNTVWGYIAGGRGIGLINGSLSKQLPPGIVLVDLSDPSPALTTEAVWHGGEAPPALARVLDVAEALAQEQGWR
jgi:DNA-binding transcriptional LysR family regulator